MPTQQEAAYYYRYYSNLYQEARSDRNRANGMLDESVAKKRQNESLLSECKAQKKNLEERLRGVKNIISFFLNDVTQCVNRANCSAESAGEKYITAIRCDTITSASIGRTFHSSTIDEDTLMLAPAFQSCNDEKDRLEKSIQTMSEQITRFNNAISSLESDICRYRSIASNAEGNMRTYRARASYYAPYM